MSRNANYKIPPTFVFDLDLPPHQRWLPILQAYENQMSLLRVKINQLVEQFLPWSWMRCLVRNCFPQIPMMYKEELQCISDFSNISLGYVMVMQLMYEMCAACTSIIWRTNDPTNALSLMRTMDWDLPFLKDLTIQLDVKRNNQTIVRVVTWVGYVGFLTGVNSNAALSVNFRSSDRTNTWNNLWRAICWYWPIGFLTREVLVSNASHEKTLTLLQNSKLIAPCYFSLCSSQSAHIIIRDPEQSDLITLKDDENFLVQTNTDHLPVAVKHCKPCQTNFLYSRERLQKVYNYFQSHQQQNHHHQHQQISENDMWNLTEQYPILNEETIYTSFMIPSLVLRTRV